MFGIEVTCEHVEIFGEERFFKAVVRPCVFHLWRENLVAQTVSIYKAVKTGHFHSTDGVAAADPEFIPAEMANWYRYMARVENGNVELMKRRGIVPVNLTYETIFADPYKTLLLFHDALNREMPQTATISSKVEKIASDWNALSETTFRTMFASLIEETENNRLVKTLSMRSVLEALLFVHCGPGPVEPGFCGMTE